MAEFFKKIGAFLRRCNITYRRRYDTEGSLALGGDDTAPKFSYALKGNYTISLGRVLAVLASVASFLFAIRVFLAFIFSSGRYLNSGKRRKAMRAKTRNKKQLKKKH